MKREEFQSVSLWAYKKVHEKGQVRRDSNPATSHPGRVGIILNQKGLRHFNDDEEDYLYSLVAFCHDMIEDEIATYEEIREAISNICGEQIGKAVADRVQILSKDPKLKNDETYLREVYIPEIERDEITRHVKIADRIDNVQKSSGLKNKKGYILETEWFLDLAKGTVFEEDLNQALEQLRKIVREEELRESVAIGESR